MTTSQKVLLTILLAVAAVLLLGNGPRWREHLLEIEPPRSADHTTDIEFLQRAFRVYNHEYFQDRLNTPAFNTDEEQMQATTHCYDGGVNCTLSFNLFYLRSSRNAEIAVLHEQCHMKTWDDDQNGFILSADAVSRHHAKKWRACMIDLDNQGAFRNILIDFYKGAE
jgi:hypothetical protein